MCSPMVLSCGAGTAAATSSSAVTLEFTGSPSVVTLGDWTFLNVTGYNAWYFGLDIVMFAVWKTTENGTIVAVETEGSSVAAGQTAISTSLCSISEREPTSLRCSESPPGTIP